MAAVTPILQANGVRFLDILTYPDLAIPAGRATFITGESGSGKSTLLKLFNGVLSPSAGTLLYNGQNTAEINAIALRREVLLVSQSVWLFDGSIRHNFAEFYKFRDLPAPDAAVINRALELCSADFDPDTDTLPMSGGERQRVYLAIFLSFAPQVLMLDEPSSALDAATAARLMDNLKAHCAAAGTTLVVVSHDAALVDAYADERICLSCEHQTKGERPPAAERRKTGEGVG